MLTLKAKTRNIGKGMDILRKAGEIPAVFYGAGKVSTSISVGIVDFKKIWQKAGESSTIVVSTPDGDVNALIHDVQADSITGEPIHIDFLVLDMNKKIKVKVALEFTGISNAVKTGLGTLVKVLHEIEVEALPKDLPHSILVDISKLADLHSQILISDLSIPVGVSIMAKDSDVVVSIAEQVEEKEEVAAPVDLAAIEVEKKGKKEEEGVPGADSEAK